MRTSTSRTALLYALLTGLWIFVIDVTVDVLVIEPHGFVGLHGVLGITTVALLYILLGRELRARERAEASRMAVEQRMASLLDATLDAIIAVDDDRRIFLFNQGAQRIFGYHKEEVLGQPLEVLLPSRFSEVHRQHLREFALAPETTGRMDARRQVSGRRKDGSEFPAEASISKLSQDGRTVFTVILHDITARQQAEDALRQAHDALETRVKERTTDLTRANEALYAEIVERRRAEAERERLLAEVDRERQRVVASAGETELANRLLHALIDTMPAGVIVADADGSIVLTNAAARSIIGGAVSGNAHRPRGYQLARVDGTPLPAVDMPLSRALWRGEVMRGAEALVRRQDGSEAAILMAAGPVRDDSGDVVSAVAIFQDITKRKQMEQALLESEETARALLNVSPESALLVDTQGTVLAVNEIAARRMGAGVHQMTGACVYDFLPPDEATAHRAHGDEVARTGKPARFEDERFGRKIDNYVHPVFDADGKVVRLALFGHDITERKLAEQQAQRIAVLEERQHLARELHDSLSQALYGVALGAHTAWTLLDSDRAKVVEALEYVISLADAGLTEMRALIFDLRPESLEMEGLARALVRQAAAVRARYGIAVETDLCDEPPVVLEMKEAIYRVAQEAMHNVAKHAQAGHLHLRLGCGEEEVRLEVMDDGVGFDTTAAYPGHLGLRSMRERVERLGGTFEVQSVRGKGTRVHARFPAPDRPPEAFRAPAEGTATQSVA